MDTETYVKQILSEHLLTRDYKQITTFQRPTSLL
jgi:hypothetical protein